jgi:hypothetical protein
MSSLQLINRHLNIDAETAARFFPAATHLSIVYYESNRTLLIAAAGDELFKSLHKTNMLLLKDKNSRGDKSLSLEELLIDNDLDPSDRTLQHKADATMTIITVYF